MLGAASAPYKAGVRDLPTPLREARGVAALCSSPRAPARMVSFALPLLPAASRQPAIRSLFQRGQKAPLLASQRERRHGTPVQFFVSATAVAKVDVGPDMCFFFSRRFLVVSCTHVKFNQTCERSKFHSANVGCFTSQAPESLHFQTNFFQLQPFCDLFRVRGLGRRKRSARTPSMPKCWAARPLELHFFICRCCLHRAVTGLLRGVAADRRRSPGSGHRTRRGTVRPSPAWSTRLCSVSLFQDTSSKTHKPRTPLDKHACF